MVKKNKILIAYVTSFVLLIGANSLRFNKEKANDITNQINEYLEDFSDDDFLIAAHRGFSSLEVENTEDAIRLADEKDYIDYIEIDIRMTKEQIEISDSLVIPLYKRPAFRMFIGVAQIFCEKEKISSRELKLNTFMTWLFIMSKNSLLPYYVIH